MYQLRWISCIILLKYNIIEMKNKQKETKNEMASNRMWENLYQIFTKGDYYLEYIKNSKMNRKIQTI
jgi:hypothetical protein